MTNEQALREALKYIADCLEKDELYLIHMDEFVSGDSMTAHLIRFARRIASDKDLANWLKWCERKAGV